LLLVLALALASAVVLGSVFVTSGRPEVVAMQAFSPLTLPVLVGALLLLVIPIGGSLGRRVLVPVALVVVLALSAGVVRQAPIWTAAAHTGDASLRVVTANLRFGEADPDAVMRLLRAEQPELVVFQEITLRAQAALEDRGLRSLLPYSAGVATPGARGTMVFATTPLTDAEPIVTEHGSWAFTFRDLRVWGVHPAYPFSSRWLDEQRKLSRLATAEQPDLALGDFNATFDHPSFRRLLAEAGLTDAAEASGAGWQPTWPRGGSRGLPMPVAAIDHVLVGESLIALSTRVHDIPGTDHRALVADLAIVGS
jgi:endonuclease/exonuclease/phosphatase (EEP) superfamily protein YafD